MTIRSGDSQRTHCGNDKMHTHAHVGSQFGKIIWASAKPEKRNKNANGAARSDILRPVALGVRGLEGTGDDARKQSIEGCIY